MTDAALTLAADADAAAPLGVAAVPSSLDAASAPVLQVRGAAIRFGNRTLWSDLDLDVRPGELIAILGANGTGKTTLFKAILGQTRLSTGSINLLGGRVRRGDHRIGSVPQQRIFAASVPMLGRDLVTFGRTGRRFGPPITSAADRAAVDAAITAAGATSLADRPIGSLSGGEQQRLRLAQAIVDEPSLLLCDEPLSSLDLGHQRAIVDLIDTQRARGAGVLFITHDVNPILDVVDRILYLAPGGHRIGTPDEVLRSEVLTDLYGTPVDVVRVRDRVIVVGGPDDTHHAHEGHEHPEPDAPHEVMR